MKVIGDHHKSRFCGPVRLKPGTVWPCETGSRELVNVGGNFTECPCKGGQRTGVAAGELRPHDRFVVVVVLCVILNRRSKCVFVFEESV